VDYKFPSIFLDIFGMEEVYISNLQTDFTTDILTIRNRAVVNKLRDFCVAWFVSNSWAYCY